MDSMGSCQSQRQRSLFLVLGPGWYCKAALFPQVSIARVKTFDSTLGCLAHSEADLLVELVLLARSTI